MFCAYTNYTPPKKTFEHQIGSICSTLYKPQPPTLPVEKICPASEVLLIWHFISVPWIQQPTAHQRHCWKVRGETQLYIVEGQCYAMFMVHMSTVQ